MNFKDIKIVGVIDEEPFDYRTWSGTSRYFFAALRDKGYLYRAVSAEPSKIVRYFYKCNSFNPDISKWKFKYRINVDYYRQMTKAALRKIIKIDDKDYNVVLQVGAWYDLTGRKNKITISYHDGNLHSLLKRPFGYPRVPEKYIKRALNYEKALYEKIDHIFPMSKWLADSFIKDFGIKSNKLMPVGAGVNLPYINDVKNKSYDQPNILFIGKDFERKGGMQLLEAFKIVRKEIKNATLTIIGPNIKTPLEGIRCVGYVSKNTKKGIDFLLSEYSSASIFVMPSLYEPFGIVFAEAMAHKLPCIGTNVCAMPEIIDDGINGYIVPTNDIKALAGKIIELLKDPEMCGQMGENAYQKYIKHYTWDTVVNKIIDGIKNN